MKSTPRKVYDKDAFIRAIKEKLPDSKLLSGLVRYFNAGDLMLKENSSNNCLFVVLDGEVSQVKEGKKFNTKIDRQGPGDFIGLLSFQTGEPVFTSAKAHTDVTVLAIDHGSFEELLQKYPDISHTLQGLIFLNLSDRYRRVVSLHVEVDVLSQELKNEKSQLKKIIRELEDTRNILVSQEKMAVLGEMTAGLAHEMNNPASALLRSVDFLINNLPVMLEKASHMPHTCLVRYFFECGHKRVFGSSAHQRQRVRELSERFPLLKRNDIRVMADMDTEAFEKIAVFAHEQEHHEMLRLFIEAFQAGVFMNGIRLSAARIEYLVKSLKSFSRQSSGVLETIDIRPGIMETLQILGNQLKNINVEVNLPDIPMVNCFPGEINQVWTNIIINACDAMENKGNLYVSCKAVSSDFVEVRIADSGPGIPDRLKKKVFDSSFTTKTAGGEFGLGIGLAISKGIVEKHQGEIIVEDRKGGGAEFVVRLPSVKV